MKPHLIIKGSWTQKWYEQNQEGCSQIFSQNGYYTLPPEIKLLTINFVDPKDQTGPEDQMSYFDILNKMDVTLLISSRIQMDN